ncbi:MAG: serine/threonine protein kinase [Gloeobacteraceae cyanobacterium ES-bin-144]|nr:serine/threonine protein kinase [Verrucomicrobiales bacterium]
MLDPVEDIAYCPSCGAPMDVTLIAPYTNVGCPSCGTETRVKREFGPYTLLRRHAVGGMSMVFVAQDNTLDREVALKILSEEFSSDERRIQAFEEEARITASFSHPHVVRVLRTGRAFGRFYIAMELVPGGHFEHQIRVRGKIPELEMLPIAIEVAQGLKAAHEAGLIHRDVKPGNILLDAEGHAKLVDFGLALVTHGGTAQATELWATPYYVPPETVEGNHEDFRSDIYSFGATLYHSLSGNPSCGEQTMDTDALREAKKNVVSLAVAESSISFETCRVVDKAMAYLPNARYASYDELISDLEGALKQLRSGNSDSPISAAQRRAAKKRKERDKIIMGVLGGLALLGLASWWITRPKSSKPTVAVSEAESQGQALPVEQDSGEIMKGYLQARSEVEAKNYDAAAKNFLELHKNPNLQEPTRTWAGVEVLLANFLAGHSSEAKRQAKEIMGHVLALPEGTPGIGAELIGVIKNLNNFSPLEVSKIDSNSDGMSKVIALMLSGLKNWEQGMPVQAAECFKAVKSEKLSVNANWVAIYQTLADDYLADYQIISGPLFTNQPTDKTGIEITINELDAALAKMKTRGRAKFDVRAWQLDLARQAKLLSRAQSATSKTDDTFDEKAPEKTEVFAKINEFASEYRFAAASEYIKTLNKDPDGIKRVSLLVIVEAAADFLADLEMDLAKEPVLAGFPVKSGETLSRISCDAQGAVIAYSNTGELRKCKLTDFSADSLVGLYRALSKTPKTEAQQIRRHECAIAFDWLVGNRERAVAAAAVLAQSSPDFKKRWEEVVSGLPQD